MVAVVSEWWKREAESGQQRLAITLSGISIEGKESEHTLRHARTGESEITRTWTKVTSYSVEVG